ncbi:hypothetical protein ACOMHN_052595 [Nucella lapillus]
MSMFLLLLAIATISGTAHANRCACATANVNLRSGLGTSYGHVYTLSSHHCLPHDGREGDGGEYTWYHMDFHGQDVWGASDWLIIQDCPSGYVLDNTDSRSSNNNNNNHGNHDDARFPGCPRIITRSEWDARAPNHAIADMPALPVYVFIHHGASSSCENEETCKQKVREYQDYHMDEHGWWDIGYNFLVGEDGNAYEARGWNEQGAHTRGYNSNGIAICFIGNFMKRLPSAMAQRVALNLIQCGLANHKIQTNYTLKGHRDVGSTLCPGDQLYERIHGWPHYVSGAGLYNPPGSVVG